jgi:hypothetical protein
MRSSALVAALVFLGACSPSASDGGGGISTGGTSGSGGQIGSGGNSGSGGSASAGSGGQLSGGGGQGGGSGGLPGSGGQAGGAGGQGSGSGGESGAGGQGGGSGGVSGTGGSDAGKGPDAESPASDAPLACGAGGTGFDTGTAGVAFDRKTCLAWERNEPARDVSACPLMIRYFDSQLCWAEAAKYCTALRVDGKSDWRLPTIPELETLVVKTNSPALDKTIFPQAVLSIYWSSEKKGEKIVAVDFSNMGMVNDHIGPDGPQAVRCVRGPLAGK